MRKQKRGPKPALATNRGRSGLRPYQINYTV